MAVLPSSSPETLAPNPTDKSDAPSTAASQDPSTADAPSTTGDSNPNPNPNPNPTIQAAPAPVAAPPPPIVPSFAPSFRPLSAPVVPQYSAVVQNPGVQMPPMAQPPGVQVPGAPPGGAPIMGGGVAVGPMPIGGIYQSGPVQAMGGVAVPMGYGQVPNGYMAVPQQMPIGISPAGIPRYPSPYPMYRPGFPPRPIPGMLPQMPRLPIAGIRGIPPMVTPLTRPIIPIVVPEKPQTTVWVGKIAPTVDNEFILSVLKLCGPMKSWKRPQGPSDGTLKSFGFCEFESAEGVLRSLRLLNKLRIDGQELMLNINEATKKYLKQYVEKKTEMEKLKESDSAEALNDNKSTEGAVKVAPIATSAEDAKNSEDSENKDKEEINDKFGLVTDEDREADRDATEKIKGLIEERLKNKPIAPPPKIQSSVDTSANSNSEILVKSKEGDSDIDVLKNDASKEKNDDETTSGNKVTSENDKTEISSPDKARSQENRSRDRDRDRDEKMEKEREIERVERERERERVRREREREYKTREAERLYKDRLKEWEARERDKEHQRQYEKEREKERERERRKEIMRQEEDIDYDDSRKRKRRTNTFEEKKRKRQREKEEDFNDRLKEEEEEEEETAEAERRAIEEQQMKDFSKSPKLMTPESQNSIVMEEGKFVDMGHTVSDLACNASTDNNYTGDMLTGPDSGDDVAMSDVASSNLKQNNSAPARKLGFGLIGSGKRTTVPSVFHEEDDESVDDKKMRPLVPIDYSAEELEAVQTNTSGAQANLVAAAEFAKRISGSNTKEEKESRRSADKANLRERDRYNYKEESRDKVNGKNSDRDKDREDKPKAESKKLLDAKQLIDMIPKTKEELFVYEINWEIYDVHQLHERMRPWISKKITEFLGEEEATLVDYIVKCIKEHVQASKMLELLQAILDDEAEMFVLKMWRMLIFEVKKVETGLSAKLKS